MFGTTSSEFFHRNWYQADNMRSTCPKGLKGLTKQELARVILSDDEDPILRFYAALRHSPMELIEEHWRNEELIEATFSYEGKMLVIKG